MKKAQNVTFSSKKRWEWNWYQLTSHPVMCFQHHVKSKSWAELWPGILLYQVKIQLGFIGRITSHTCNSCLSPCFGASSLSICSRSPEKNKKWNCQAKWSLNRARLEKILPSDIPCIRLPLSKFDVGWQSLDLDEKVVIGNMKKKVLS